MKKMFIVSAIMLFAVGAMTSCKDSAENGCKCDYSITEHGQTMSGTREVSAEEVKEAGYNSCKAYAKDAEKEGQEIYEKVSISCKGK